MTTAIRAKFQNGVLEPLTKINLHEGEEVTVHLDMQDHSEQEWLNAAAQDTADRLSSLEADMSKDEVARWHKEMNRASKPARYVPKQGIITGSV